MARLAPSGKFQVAFGALCFIIFCFSSSTFANDVPQTFSLDGQLFSDPAGTTPLNDPNIAFRIQILSEDKSCILYEESQSTSTAASKGFFSVQVGSSTGSTKRTVTDPGRTMVEVFSNLLPVTGKSVATGTPCVVTAVGGNRRYVRMIIAPSTLGSTERTLSPDLNVDSVPNAVVAERAESIQGVRKDALLQVNTASGVVLSQANLENLFSNSTRFDALKSVVDGTSTVYMRSSSTTGAQLPIIAGAPGTTPSAGSIWYDSGDQLLKFQTTVGTQILSTGTNSITSLTGEVTASGPGAAAATVVSVGGSTAANIHAATLLSNGATETNTATAIVRRDGTGGFLAGNVNVASSRLRDSGSNYVTLDAPTTVTSNYGLTFPAAVGAAGQTLVTTDTSGTLAWTTPLSTSTSFSGDVSGTASTTSVDKIKGTAVTVTGIATGNYLRYNGTAWVNSGLVAGDVTTALTYTPVNRAGDTMTGLLTLSADPTNPLHAATKQYADSKLLARDLPAAPAVGQDGYSLRWNQTSGAWEYYNPATTSQWTSNAGNIYFNTGNVGIGAQAPADTLTLQKTDQSTAVAVTNTDSSTARYPGLYVTNYMGSANAGFPLLDFYNSRGVAGSQTAVQSGDSLVAIQANGLHSSGANLAGRIAVVATETFSATNGGGQILLQTTANGTTTYQTRMTVDHSGYVGIGNTSPRALLDVAIPASNTTTPAEIIVSTHDATYNPAAITLLSKRPNMGLKYGDATVKGWRFYSYGDSGGHGGMASDAAFCFRDGTASEKCTMHFDGPTGNINFGGENASLHTGSKVNVRGNMTVGTSWSTYSTQVAAPADSLIVEGRIGAGVSDPTTQLDIGGTTTVRGLSAPPAVSASGQGRLYFDSVSGKFMISENGAAYAAISSGATTLSGDVSGSNTATSVDKIKGTAVTVTGIATGDLFRYNGSAWVNSQLSTNDVTTALTYTPVNRAGDTMTGVLTLSADPTANLHSTTKQYVDAALATSAANFVRRDGTAALTADWDIDGAGAGTRLLTGLAPPIAGDSAANKTYVDTHLLNQRLPSVTPGSGQNGQALRWNNSASEWEFFAPTGSGVGTVLVDSGGANTGTSANALQFGVLTNSGEAIGSKRNGGGNQNGLDFYTNYNSRMSITNGGNVGIGTSTPTSRLEVTANPWDVLTGTGNTLNVSTFMNNGANSDATLNGIRSFLYSDINFNNEELNASFNHSAVLAGTATANIARGSMNKATLEGPGTLVNGYGTQSLVELTSTGTITNAYGLYSDVAKPGGGSITNAYGLYVDTLAGTNRYGVYQHGVNDKNYFAGRVGIGTDDPIVKFHVRRDVNTNDGILVQNMDTGSSAYTGMAIMTDRTRMGEVQFVDQDNVTMPAGWMGYNHSTNAMYFGTNEVANRMVINSSGKVGIGTSGPKTALEVNGSATAGPDGIVRITQTGGSTFNGPFALVIGDDAMDTNNYRGFRLSIDSNGNGVMESYIAGASKDLLFQPNGGNIGIGVLVPTTKLQVAGDIAPDTTATKNLGSGSLRWNNIYLSNAPDVSSDERLKKEIKTSDLGLDFINNLEPVSWVWKDPKRGTVQHYGVIAQQAEAAIAKAKGQATPNVIVSHNEESDSYSVRYTELISPIIKAIQELYQEVLGVKSVNDSQTRQIASTDEKLQKLESENDSLKQENAAIKKYLCEKDPSAPICK